MGFAFLLLASLSLAIALPLMIAYSVLLFVSLLMPQDKKQ